MINAKEEDDIDLFIITAKNRLFTGRFIAVCLAALLRIRRRRSGFHFLCSNNKVCLNLFFDQSCLTVPDFKKTEYVAHEVLQMKPLINKEDIYQRFLIANQWVSKFFPNALNAILKLKVESPQYKLPRQNFKFPTVILNVIAEVAEKVLKLFQMYFINQHKTTELITENQLWFHPEDFGKKVARF